MTHTHTQRDGQTEESSSFPESRQPGWHQGVGPRSRLVWRYLEMTRRDPPLLDLVGVVIGGSDPPPPVLVDANDLNLLATGQLDAIVTGSWAIVCDGRVVPWSPWCLEREGELESSCRICCSTERVGDTGRRVGDIEDDVMSWASGLTRLW